MSFTKITSYSILLLLVVLCTSPLCHGGTSHSIKDLLAASKSFTEFSGALDRANLTAEIDRRTTLTVLAVDNAVMAKLKENLSPDNFSHAVSLHVLLDYFDDDKLHNLGAGSANITSLYQASGKASSSEGIVTITARQDGRVASFAPSDVADPSAFYQKTIVKVPYDIAVLQVSGLFWSPAAADGKAPAPAPVDQQAPSPSPQSHRAPSPKRADSPAPAPKPADTPAPVKAPSPAESHPAPPPKRANTPAPAPKPVDAPAPGPGGADDDQPPADEKKNDAADAEPWSLGVAAAAAVAAFAFLL